LQNYQKTGEGALRYVVFDLLELDGRDLRADPSRVARNCSRRIIVDLPNVQISEHVADSGVAFFRAAVAQGIGRIMAKDGTSPYREGARHRVAQDQNPPTAGSGDRPASPRHAQSKKTSARWCSAWYDGKELVYIGHTGGGFDDAGLTDMRARLPAGATQVPFATRPKTNASVRW